MMLHHRAFPPGSISIDQMMPGSAEHARFIKIQQIGFAVGIDHHIAWMKIHMQHVIFDKQKKLFNHIFHCDASMF